MVPWKLVAFATSVGTICLLLFTISLRNSDIGECSSTISNRILSKMPAFGFDLMMNKISLEELDIESLKFLLHSMLLKNTKVCNKTVNFGRASADGGYAVCLDGPLSPVPGHCTVLSFGINNEWSFDEAAANHSCKVNSFDPSMGMEDHLHKKDIQFYNTGLGKSNEINDKGWKVKNIMTILKDLGKTDQVIDIIKCDAEGAEWPFLEDLALNKIKVKQIILEIHPPKINPQKLTKNDFIYMISIFHQLKKRGYMVWRNNIFYNCCLVFPPMMPPGISEKCCYEIYIYNSMYH